MRSTTSRASSTREWPDGDGDGIPDGIDNCPLVPNADQARATDSGEIVLIC